MSKPGQIDDADLPKVARQIWSQLASNGDSHVALRMADHIEALEAERDLWAKLATKGDSEIGALKAERDALQRDKKNWKDTATKIADELISECDDLRAERDRLRQEVRGMLKLIEGTYIGWRDEMHKDVWRAQIKILAALAEHKEPADE